MKILFITPRLPYPPDRGDKVRVYNFAKALSKKHSLSLASLIQTESELEYEDNLQEIFVNVELTMLKSWKANLNMLLHLCSPLPLQVCRFSSRKMRNKVRKIVKEKNFDLIYAFHLRSAQYVRRLQSTKPYKVLDLTDSVSLLLQRMLSHTRIYLKPIYYREWITTQRYERQITHQFDECWFISNVDKEAVKEISSSSKIAIVPNGVDTEYFAPPKSKPDEKNLLFVGYMGLESVDAVLFFYKKIFPIIREKVPSAKFYIVGANPPKKITKLRENKDIIVTGFVEDLRPYYDNSAVMVAPMRFVVGVQNKILEAMAMEVPVVTTHFGNEGIGACPEKEIFVADNPKEFANYIINLLRNEKLRKKIGKNARKFVKERFTWGKVVNKVDEISEILREK